MKTRAARPENREAIPLLLTLGPSTLQRKETDPLVEDDATHDLYSFLCDRLSLCDRLLVSIAVPRWHNDLTLRRIPVP